MISFRIHGIYLGFSLGFMISLILFPLLSNVRAHPTFILVGPEGLVESHTSSIHAVPNYLMPGSVSMCSCIFMGWLCIYSGFIVLVIHQPICITTQLIDALNVSIAY